MMSGTEPNITRSSIRNGKRSSSSSPGSSVRHSSRRSLVRTALYTARRIADGDRRFQASSSPTLFAVSQLQASCSTLNADCMCSRWARAVADLPPDPGPARLERRLCPLQSQQLPHRLSPAARRHLSAASPRQPGVAHSVRCIARAPAHDITSI